MQRHNFSIRMLALLLALLLAQPLALVTKMQAESPGVPQLPDPGTPGMTKDQQIKLGLQAMGEVYKQMPVLPDSSPETQYIQHLGKKLAAVIPADKAWPYQFHVIPAADINAFALPGGPIFVNLGTITAADNEAELAGVLAHEMSHVYMQHSAKQAPKATVAQVIAGLAGAVLPQSGLGSLGRMGIQIGAGTMLMKYSRADEAQADSTGAIIMYRAGYNPKAMADFFQKLEQKYGKGGPQLLSDHPNPGNRMANIEKQIQNWPPKNYISNSPEFAQVKQDALHIKAYTAQEIANGAKAGTWEQQNKKNKVVPANLPSSSNPGSGNGSGEGSGGGTGEGATDIAYKEIKPSANFTRHQGQGFSISYPDNWKVGGDQNTTLIAPPSAAAQNGISYGVIVGNNSNSNASSLDEATQQLAQGLQKDNPGMKISGQMKNVDVNGMQGRSLELSGNSPLQLNGQPLPERDWLVTVPRPQGGLSYLVFVSPERDFNQLHPTYQKMLDSLQIQ
ncbi:MAG TPA: M48 family metallopeptidase [Candidatus Angelobacter sp.]|nr:M48 family metallopeptidase [Candidatus Angelobacter sp.]